MQKSIIVFLISVFVVYSQVQNTTLPTNVTVNNTVSLYSKSPSYNPMLKIKQIEGIKFGGWQKENILTFVGQNSSIVQEAVNAVDTKYDPESQGYHFQTVLRVDEQVVAGTNYMIELQYQNDTGETYKYIVVIYSAPWNNQNQVVSIRKINTKV